MSKELNCMNCSIGDFKNNLCDCNNGFCKEFKSIGRQEDFFNAVIQRIRPQGEWIKHKNAEEICGTLISNYECSLCHEWQTLISNFCPSCGARMKGVHE